MKQFSENFLYHIWDGFHFVNPLRTISGKKIEVVFQGRWNTSAGPDFLSAVIKINGKLIKGDVEIHINTTDWKAHNHYEDPNYNNVILHVVFVHNSNEKYTITENGNISEIVQIASFLDSNVEKLIKKYDHKFEPEDKFCNFFASTSLETLPVILTEMGMERLNRKIKRFNSELVFNSFDQIFYSGFLEAMGYSKNKLQMIRLAENIPFVKLKRFVDLGLTYEQFIAIILVTSGLINVLPKTFPNQFKIKWHNIFLEQNFIKEYLDIKWDVFRIRPANNPAIRFLQIAPILYNAFAKGFLYTLNSLFAIPVNLFKINDFKKRLYSFFAHSSYFLPDNYKLGKSRIDTILINIILPLVVIYSQKMLYKELENTVIFVYKNYPKLPNNFILDYMSKFMNVSQRKMLTNKSIFQQGILHLYYGFCQKHMCVLCENNRKELLKKL